MTRAVRSVTSRDDGSPIVSSDRRATQRTKKFPPPHVRPNVQETAS